MKITKETTIQQGDKKRKSLRINIPAIFRDIMDLKQGDVLVWIMTDEKEIKLRKK